MNCIVYVDFDAPATIGPVAGPSLVRSDSVPDSDSDRDRAASSLTRSSDLAGVDFEPVPNFKLA